MANESKPSVHPCIDHGHSNNYFNLPIGSYFDEDGKSLPRYSPRRCTVCHQVTCYDYQLKQMVPVATMFQNVSSALIPGYLQKEYIDWLKFRENSTHYSK